MRRFLTLENFVLLTLIFIIINLIVLDISFFQNKQQTEIVSNKTNLDCEGCESKIAVLEANVAKLLEETGITLTPTPYITPIIQTNNVQQAVPAASTKEYYIPFGSGSGSYTDWTDIPGLQAYIDSTSYGKIKTVVFEASLHIPTGNQTASIRLINATDGRVIANSQLDFNGNTESTLLSSQVTLDYGQKLYKVQLKTQLKYNAILDQSRVHVSAQ